MADEQMRSPRVHIVVRGGDVSGERVARALAGGLENVTFGTGADPDVAIHYYLGSETWRGRVSELEIGRVGESAEADRFALCMDHCVVASEAARARLQDAGAREVHVVAAADGDTAGRRGDASWVAAHARLFAAIAARSDTSPRVSPPLRVFLSGDASERAHRGGPSVRIAQTAAALRRRGHEVDVGESLADATDRYDVAHLFNSWPAASSLERIETARAAGVATVLSPIYMDHRETAWARQVLRGGWLAASRSPRGWIARARLQRTPRERRTRESDDVRAYHRALERMVALADHVVCLSHAELAGLRAAGCAPASQSFVWNTVDPAPFAAADRERFRRELALGDYVVCVGRIEFRKNQAMLLRAMRRTALDVVVIGSSNSRRYQRAIDALSGPRVHHLDHLAAGGERLASAIAGAAAFVLPSWVEGAPISALEAAAAGTPLVLGDRAGVREYFGALAHYCDPSDAGAIRRATLAAIEGDSPALRERRRALIAQKLTLEVAARETEAAYLRAIARAIARRRARG